MISGRTVFGWWCDTGLSPVSNSGNPIQNQTAFYEVMGGEVVIPSNAVRRWVGLVE